MAMQLGYNFDPYKDISVETGHARLNQFMAVAKYTVVKTGHASYCPIRKITIEDSPVGN